MARLEDIKNGASVRGIRSHSDTKPHLAYLQVAEHQRVLGGDGPLGVESEADGEIFIPDTPGV